MTSQMKATLITVARAKPKQGDNNRMTGRIDRDISKRSCDW